jgi:hypothetical protein
MRFITVFLLLVGIAACVNRCGQAPGAHERWVKQVDDIAANVGWQR